MKYLLVALLLGTNSFASDFKLDTSSIEKACLELCAENQVREIQFNDEDIDVIREGNAGFEYIIRGTFISFDGDHAEKQCSGFVLSEDEISTTASECFIDHIYNN